MRHAQPSAGLLAPTDQQMEAVWLPLTSITEEYAHLRFVQPRAEQAMERSFRRYGQLTPVMVGQHKDDGHPMVDGYKRLRAARKLGFNQIEARLLPGNNRALLAAMIFLNTRARTISDLETALVIRRLCRRENLSQVEIARLLNRHKSWVCRRISLVEHLDEQVMDYLRVGLINLTTCRELIRLPRCNQQKALATVLEHRLTSRETRRLVCLLLDAASQSHLENMLWFPEQILQERQQPRPTGFLLKLLKLEQLLGQTPPETLSSMDRGHFQLITDRIKKAIDKISVSPREPF